MSNTTLSQNNIKRGTVTTPLSATEMVLGGAAIALVTIIISALKIVGA
jgi:hypothetical protein